MRPLSVPMRTPSQPTAAMPDGNPTVTAHKAENCHCTLGLMSRYHYSTEITDYQQVHSDIDMDYAFDVATCMMTDVNATFLLMSPCSILAVNAFAAL